MENPYTTDTKTQLQTFILPDEFSERLQELEIDLHEGNLNVDTLNELFELYSTASTYYESNGMVNEFNFFLMKMQNLMKNEKIQHILKRRKSKELTKKYSITLEEKKEKVEKIKNLIKQSKIPTKEIANNMIEEINKETVKTQVKSIIHKDINNQEESFKKKLEEKRSRGNSLPHLKLKSKLGLNKPPNETQEIKINAAPSDDIIQNFQQSTEHNNASTGLIPLEISMTLNANSDNVKLERAKTPPKRLSIMTMTTFGVSAEEKTSFYHRKPTDQEMTTDKKTSVSSKCTADDIIDPDTEEKIEANLIKLWQIAVLHSQEHFTLYENEISSLLHIIYEEKSERTIEIHSRYEKELKDLQTDLDLNDETNVNTIIYKEIIRDREQEISNLGKEIEEKKYKGLLELKEKYVKLQNNNEKIKEIKMIKQDISQGIKDKLNNTLSLRSEFNKLRRLSSFLDPKSNYKQMKSKNSDDSFDSYEEREVVTNLTSRKNSSKKEKIKSGEKLRSPPVQKRVSRGYVGFNLTDNIS